MRVFITAIFLLTTLTSPIFAQENTVVINEFSSASDPEWVELYNKGENETSLEGCTLRMQENEDTNQKISFSSEDVIDKFLLVEKGDYNWSSNWLANTGDQIVLTCPTGEDSVSYGNASGAIVEVPNDNQCAGRSPDGIGSWALLAMSTPGEKNALPPTLTPSPTPTPTKTPTPAKTPTPTSTPNPTSTPKPEPTEKPADSPTPTDKPASEAVLGETLGEVKEAVYVRLPTLTASEAASLSASLAGLLSPTATPSASFFKPWHFLFLGFAAIVAMTVSAFKVNKKKEKLRVF